MFLSARRFGTPGFYEPYYSRLRERMQLFESRHGFYEITLKSLEDEEG